MLTVRKTLRIKIDSACDSDLKCMVVYVTKGTRLSIHMSDRPMDRQTGRQTGRQTERQTKGREQIELINNFKKVINIFKNEINEISRKFSRICSRESRREFSKILENSRESTLPRMD